MSVTDAAVGEALPTDRSISSSAVVDGAGPAALFRLISPPQAD